MTRRSTDDAHTARARIPRPGRPPPPAAEGLRPEGDDRPSGRLEPARLVVAEPNTLMLADLVEMIEATGARVVATAATVGELDRAERATGPDAVVLEYGLPGGAMAERLNRFEAAGLPVLITTALAHEDLPRETPRRLILVKPYSQALLSHALRRLGLLG